MSKYFIPGILFGCSAGPTPAQIVVEASISSSIECPTDSTVCRSGPNQNIEPPSGWSESFKYWSSRSQNEMVEAINAESRENAARHELRALASLRMALNQIPDADRWFLPAAAQQQFGDITASLEGHHGEIDGQSETSTAVHSLLESGVVAR